MRRRPADDFDTAWKEMLRLFFRLFMEFFFPDAAREIDWDHGIVFLDKELNQAVKLSGTGRRLVDTLAQVRLKSGSMALILAHVEVQSQVDTDLPLRMYLCGALIHGREHKPVASFAILADSDPTWTPNWYGYELLGSEPGLKFSTIKLLDYLPKWEELKQSPNPFALVVMAHLKAMDTSRRPSERLHWKEELAILLHERGYSDDQVTALFRFLDLVMPLPQDLEAEFEKAFEKYEEKKMRVMGQFEKRVYQQGAREMVLDALEARFPDAPPSLQDRIRALENLKKLRSLIPTIIKANSVRDVEDALS